jgi:hypothetical protein
MPDKKIAIRALWFQTSPASLSASIIKSRSWAGSKSAKAGLSQPSWSPKTNIRCRVMPCLSWEGDVQDEVLAALDLPTLQRSLQYNTLSQFLAQLLRQLMARPHTAQGFWGKSCLFPLKPEGLGMSVSNEKGLA